ncbi:MAG: hypothetical protein D3911_10880 [Candidatus Electrothrix sp. AW3_4]|nr:hypothetical protein [Candidatus Electrothrix gigas]
MIDVKINVSGKQNVHLLHIGKTGGSAVKYAFNKGLNVLVDGGEQNMKTAVVSLPEIPYILQMHPHNIRLKDIPKGEKVIFFLRDPVSRFVSSFYSRKRKGAPRYCFEWDTDEHAAFTIFSSPGKLANALCADDAETSEAATKAMHSIYHVNTSFWDWFKNKEYFLSRKKDIFFIGFQENLNLDFERLKKKLELPKTLPIGLPTGKIEAHRGLHSDTDLRIEKKGENNLKKWYHKDYDFINLCQEHFVKKN